MSETTGLCVLILADPSTGQHWAEMLRPVAATIWQGTAELPAAALPDVIVAAAACVAQARGAAHNRSFVLYVGDTPAARHSSEDVRTSLVLPSDVTARELQLACRMAAKLSCLQRQRAADAALCDRLWDEAMTDPVTGLPNRRAWDKTLAEAFCAPTAQATVQADALRLCLVILDLDGFKQVNDTHGHNVGDAVLRETGAIVAHTLRHGDFIARLGGDEFGLLLRVPHEEAARAIVARVREAIPAGLAARSLPQVTACIGYGIAEANFQAATTLFTAADTALRREKRHVRNCGV